MTTPNSPQQRAIQIARQIIAQKPIYLDTETTGLDRNAEIVEISIIDHDGSILFDSLVRPTKPIPADARRIHHITDEMVRTASPWPIVWPSVRAILANRIVAIYNEEYDVRLMQQSHAQYRMPWRESLKTVCVMKLFAQFRGDWDPVRRAYRYMSLDKAGKISRITLPNSHRAADDTLLTRALLHYMAQLD